MDRGENRPRAWALRDKGRHHIAVHGARQCGREHADGHGRAVDDVTGLALPHLRDAGDLVELCRAVCALRPGLLLEAPPGSPHALVLGRAHHPPFQRALQSDHRAAPALVRTVFRPDLVRAAAGLARVSSALCLLRRRDEPGLPVLDSYRGDRAVSPLVRSGDEHTFPSPGAPRHQSALS